jgi:hypothetical protein
MSNHFYKVLRVLGIPFADFAALLDEEGCLPVDHARDLVAMIAARRGPLFDMGVWRQYIEEGPYICYEHFFEPFAIDCDTLVLHLEKAIEAGKPLQIPIEFDEIEEAEEGGDEDISTQAA